jgi:RimJ/RimL family protein N-acetyltransferase
MHLETERMILRDFMAEDLDDLHEILGDEEVMKDLESAYDKAKTEDFLNRFCINRNPKGAFAAILKENRKLIGYILFNSIDEPEIYEMGWIFNKDYWRRGYAYEICSRLISYGFEEMKLHKISAETINKEKSIPLMEKLGMKLEGMQRKHSKSNEGTWCDLYWYGILEEDYFVDKNYFNN